MIKDFHIEMEVKLMNFLKVEMQDYLKLISLWIIFVSKSHLHSFQNDY